MSGIRFCCSAFGSVPGILSCGRPCRPDARLSTATSARRTGGGAATETEEINRYAEFGRRRETSRVREPTREGKIDQDALVPVLEPEFARDARPR